MKLLNDLQKHIQRYRERDFLKAAMAASALAAYADGTVSHSERRAVDRLLESVTALNLHNPKKAVQLMTEYTTELENNTEVAESVLLGKLRRISADKEAASLIAAVALEVCYGDGYFNYAEKLQFATICEVLSVKPEDIVPDWQSRRSGSGGIA